MRPLPACAIGFVVFVPMIGVDKLRFDIRPHKDHMRMIGQELGRGLLLGAAIAVLDPNGNGLAAKFVYYELTSGSGAGRGLGISFELNAFNRDSNFKDAIVRKSLRNIWVHQPLELVKNSLNVTLPAGASHLLKSSAGGIWTVVQSWPYEGYNDPFALPD